jgi:hypothetical protein
MSSELTLKADIAQYNRHFAFVPIPDVRVAAIRKDRCVMATVLET